MIQRLHGLAFLAGLLLLDASAAALAADPLEKDGAVLIQRMGDAARVQIPPLPAPVHMSVCLYDFGGNQGYLSGLTQQVVADARSWNLYLDVRTYGSERVEAEDFKAGQCDGAVMSTLRAREFNPIIGSVDAPGNLQDFGAVRRLLQTLAKPSLAAFSTSGHFQVAAVVPVGAIYPVVRDRQLDSVEKVAGKRVLVMDWDKSQAQMVAALGAQPVPADLATFGSRFNNGEADVIAVPASAIQPLELYKGMGMRGGVIRFPLFQATATILIRRETMLARIPDLDQRLGQIRAFGLAHLDDFLQVLAHAEASVPTNYWVRLTPEQSQRYDAMLRQVRLRLTQEGVYDPTMMHILKRVRCQEDPARAECSLSDE